MSILKGPIANKIYDFIQNETYSSCGEIGGVQQAADKVTAYVEEILRIAYADGKSEGSDRATSFEWGVRKKDVSFEQWIQDNENYM